MPGPDTKGRPRHAPGRDHEGHGAHARAVHSEGRSPSATANTTNCDLRTANTVNCDLRKSQDRAPRRTVQGKGRSSSAATSTVSWSGEGPEEHTADGPMARAGLRVRRQTLSAGQPEWSDTVSCVRSATNIVNWPTGVQRRTQLSSFFFFFSPPAGPPGRRDETHRIWTGQGPHMEPAASGMGWWPTGRAMVASRP